MTYRKELVINVGAVFQQRYRVEEKLSEGGFGVIYKAEQLATGQRVALKCLRRRGRTQEEDRRQLSSFRREASICAQLHHPNIVRLIDSGQSENDIIYTVFEFVPGANLRSVIRTEGALPPTEARYLMMQVLDALACAHAEGIVHRDLKPANIMVVPTGARRNAMVLDFGIGSLLLEDDQSLDATSLRHMSTPAYASPEQLRGVDVDQRSDIYSWGLVFLECLTGRRIITGTSVATVLHAQLHDAPVPIPAPIDEHPLGQLLRTALAKDPAERTGSATEMLTRLEACDVGDLDVGSEVRARRPEAPAPRPRPRVWLARPVARPENLSVTLTEEPLAEPRSGSVDALASTGAPRVERPASEPRLAGLRPMPDENQRRQLTVVSCAIDIAEPEPETLDLEEYEELLRAHTERCATMARVRGGYVAQAAEGRVVIYHGYPSASGDDGPRAVLGALALVAAFQGSPTPDPGDTAAVRGRAVLRVGVHTGLVLIQGRASHAPPRISVATPRLANLLDTVAEPNTVVVSHATRQFLDPTFAVSSLGERRLHGSHRPVHLYRVTVPDVAPDTHGASAESVTLNRTPFVGREAELSSLRRHFNRARTGRGQAVLLTGEAGVGKSRLVYELSRQLLGQPLAWLEAHCIEDHVNSALRPIRDLFERMLGLPRHQDERLTRLHQAIRDRGLDVDHALPPLARFFGIADQGREFLAEVAPQRVRELVLHTLIALLLELAGKKPLVLVVENLQWADASTLELLGSLLHEVSMVPLFLLLTARVEFSSPWHTRLVNAYPLERLSAEDSAELVGLTSGAPLPESVVDEILARADGVPLFITETTRAVIDCNLVERESGAYQVRGKLADLEIPSTLRGLLTARLDKLDHDARSVLQLASLMGREFAYQHLSAVCWLGEDDLEAVLDSLVDDGLLYRRRRLMSGDVYLFQQALTHEAVYESIPRTTRQAYYQRIADILMDRFSALERDRSELLARVYMGAGRIDEALACARDAALACLHKSANEEAIGHADKAIAWTAAIVDERQRAEAELRFHAIIASALLGTRGHGSTAFTVLVHRAEGLMLLTGESPTVLTTLWLIWVHRHVRAEYRLGLDYAERHLALSSKLDIESARVVSRCSLASTLFYLGDYAGMLAHSRAGLELYQDTDFPALPFTVGYDPKTVLHGGVAHALWARGLLAQAYREVEAAEARAQEIDHPVTLCFAHFYRMYLDLWAGRPEHVVRRSRDMAQLADRVGLSQWCLLADLFLAAATLEPDTPARVLNAFRASGQAIGQTFWSSFSARSLARSGDMNAAIESLQHTIELAEQTEESYYLAPLYQLMGEYRLRSDDPDEPRIEACLRRAVAVARDQGASMFQLEALVSLIRWLDHTGRGSTSERAEAQGLLQTIESIPDCPPLSRARALFP